MPLMLDASTLGLCLAADHALLAVVRARLQEAVDLMAVDMDPRGPVARALGEIDGALPEVPNAILGALLLARAGDMLDYSETWRKALAGALDRIDLVTAERAMAVAEEAVDAA